MGVLQTTVAEIVTVKAQQRECGMDLTGNRSNFENSPSLLDYAIRLVPWVSSST